MLGPCRGEGRGQHAPADDGVQDSGAAVPGHLGRCHAGPGRAVHVPGGAEPLPTGRLAPVSRARYRSRDGSAPGPASAHRTAPPRAAGGSEANAAQPLRLNTPVWGFGGFFEGIAAGEMTCMGIRKGKSAGKRCK